MSLSPVQEASIGDQREVAPKSLTILGSTGSVGEQTIDLIERNPGGFEIEALSANRSVDKLADQARRLGARLAVVGDENQYGALKAALSGSGIEVAAGEAALRDAAARPSDLVMAAIVGAAGLAPALEAARRGATVALANKECLVCAGQLFIDEVERNGATLLPVDSEHSAIFQVLDAAQPEAIEKIVLTASGGPFRTMGLEDMAAVTPAQAVAHPNWEMGAKISVDSATMMNKGLEYIEAYYLFPVDKEQIEILVHPQSIIHSMVAYIDGSVLAQLGSPDMRTPIAYALAYPQRMHAPSPRLDLAQIGNLTFELPDSERFSCIRLSREALSAGDCAPSILNAANEVAVEAFLDGRVGFLDIAALVEDTLAVVDNRRVAGLDDVFAIDAEARRAAVAIVERHSASR